LLLFCRHLVYMRNYRSQAANQIALSLASLTFMFMGLSVTAMIRVKQ
jgi:hypothetical protein